jgi:hypothetical protein
MVFVPHVKIAIPSLPAEFVARAEVWAGPDADAAEDIGTSDGRGVPGARWSSSPSSRKPYTICRSPSA